MSQEGMSATEEKKIYSALTGIMNHVNELAEISMSSSNTLKKLGNLHSESTRLQGNEKIDLVDTGGVDFDGGNIIEKIDVIYKELHSVLMAQRDFIEDVNHLI